MTNAEAPEKVAHRLADAGTPLFAALTARGQARRLALLAHAALAAYDLAPRRVRLVANWLNAIFRVDAGDGRSYALRVCHPRWRTAGDLRSEVAWLNALAADTDIGAPVPIAAHNGDPFVTAAAPGVPEPRRCVLFTWLPGGLLEDRLTPANVGKLGDLAARLHAHGAQWTPPPGFTTRRMAGVYSRGEPDELFGPYPEAIFTPGSRAIFARMQEQVQGAFARRYADPRGLRVIHNDLHQGNVKLYRGRLYPFDFEDTLWGYPVQDIAMTFGDLLGAPQTSQADYEALCRAFAQGYCRRAPWPEAYPGEIDLFMAGRQLWRANWVAHFETAHARAFNTALAARFQVVLETGRLPK